MTPSTHPHRLRLPGRVVRAAALAAFAALLSLSAMAPPASASSPLQPELPPSILARLKLDALTIDAPLRARFGLPAAGVSSSAAPVQEPDTPRLVEQALGGVWGVAQAPPYLFVGVGPRLVVLERAPGQEPVIVSRTDPLPGTVIELVRQGDLLFVVADIVRVFDISTPTEPRQIGTYDEPMAGSVHVSGERMIVLLLEADGLGPGLAVVDISNPAEPLELSRRATLTQDVAIDMDVEGDIVYLATLGGVLWVYRIDDEGQLIRIGLFSTDGLGFAIEVVGDHAFFAFSLLFAGGVYVLDVSDPTLPAPVELYSPSAIFVLDMAGRGDVLYLAAGAGVEVVDIRRPTAPRRKSVLEPDRWAVSLAIDGKEALVGGGPGGGVAVLDLATPDDPRTRSARPLGGSVQSVALDEDWLLVGSEHQGMWSIEGAAPNALFDPLTSPGAAAYPFSFMDIEIADDHAFLAGQGGLAVLPRGAAPVEASFAQAGSLLLNNDLALADGRAYLLGSRGLTIFDVSSPMAPRELGRIELPGSGEALVVVASVAYVADGEEGVHRIDLSNPARPRIEATFESDGDATGVDFGLGHLFVAAEKALHVVEIDPSGELFELAYLEGAARSVRLSGERAFVLTFDGLRIVDLIEPGAPFVLSDLTLAGTCSNLAVDGSLLYIACEGAGLFVLDVERADGEPPTPTPEPTDPPPATPTRMPPTVEPTPAPPGSVYLPVLWAGE